jgi:hypothetical protein
VTVATVSTVPPLSMTSSVTGAVLPVQVIVCFAALGSPSA